MVVGLYMFVPFFVRVVRQSSPRELLILCGALFFFSMAGNAFMAFFTDNKVPALFTFIYYLPYFLAGYLICRSSFSLPAWYLWGIFFASGAVNSLGYYALLGTDGSAGDYFYNCLNITVVPMSISMMLLIKRFTAPIIAPAISSRLSLWSMGIYVIHPFFLHCLAFIGVSARSFNPLVSVPLVAALVFGLSLVASYFIGRTPRLRKVIGMR
jgi:surface polysaccharide O-acyltransferase-like enzyme